MRSSARDDTPMERDAARRLPPDAARTLDRKQDSNRALASASDNLFRVKSTSNFSMPSTVFLSGRYFT
jgi:hypothetical protein